MKIGLIGAGAIATYLIEQVEKEKKMIIHAVLVRNYKKYNHLEEKYGVTVYTDFDAFLSSDIDLVIEAANVATATKYLPQLMQHKDVIIISIGALANESFLKQIKNIAEKYEHHLYLPSGAIGGLDLVQNMAEANVIHEVNLETRKPADTLVTEIITEEKIVFQGFASEAIRKYPKNMNVSIALALAGVGFGQTKVSLIADPFIDKNIHTIRIIGDSGTATFSFTNEPLPSNPNTSYLAAISVLGTLKRIKRQISIGI